MDLLLTLSDSVGCGRNVERLSLSLVTAHAPAARGSHAPRRALQAPRIRRGSSRPDARRVCGSIAVDSSRRMKRSEETGAIHGPGQGSESIQLCQTKLQKLLFFVLSGSSRASVEAAGPGPTSSQLIGLPHRRLRSSEPASHPLRFVGAIRAPAKLRPDRSPERRSNGSADGWRAESRDSKTVRGAVTQLTAVRRSNAAGGSGWAAGACAPAQRTRLVAQEPCGIHFTLKDAASRREGSPSPWRSFARNRRYLRW